MSSSCLAVLRFASWLSGLFHSAPFPPPCHRRRRSRRGRCRSPTTWSSASSRPRTADLAVTRELLEKDPRLIKATWDWGGGDFETALGGASHMGRADIAGFLLERGAALDLFAAAMLGELSIVRAALDARPSLARVPVPTASRSSLTPGQAGRPQLPSSSTSHASWNNSNAKCSSRPRATRRGLTMPARRRPLPVRPAAGGGADAGAPASARVEVVPHASIEGRCHLDMIDRQADGSPDAGDGLGLELLEVRNEGVRRFPTEGTKAGTVFVRRPPEGLRTFHMNQPTRSRLCRPAARLGDRPPVRFRRAAAGATPRMSNSDGRRTQPPTRRPRPGGDARRRETGWAATFADGPAPIAARR